MKQLHNPEHAPSQEEPHEALERLFELGVLLAEGMDRGLADQGLTRARAEVIWRLHRGGPATQRELSESLRCTPRNVTGLVDALEAAELVGRRPHPTDRRATLVTLTEQGREAAAAWETEYQKLAAALFGDLADVRGFVTTLERVLDRLGKAVSA